jgi:flagellar biosynthesis component FlhA
VRAARLRLRSCLPGNTSNAVRVLLPSAFEEQLLGEEEGRAFLAANPAQKLAFLAWLREEMEPQSQDAVLVTRSPVLRPLLRRLVAPEFPDLMVLAEEELFSFDAPAAAVSDVAADVQHE